MNKYLKSITVLFSICLIVSLVLAAINFITAPIIEESKRKAEFESLYVVLPNAEDFEELSLSDNNPETVTAIYKDTAGGGYAITLATRSQYSEDDMLITVGIGTDRVIKNIKITSYSESRDLPQSYITSFVGKDSVTGENADTYSGATYSSKAFLGALDDAFSALDSVLEQKEAK